MTPLPRTKALLKIASAATIASVTVAIVLSQTEMPGRPDPRKGKVSPARDEIWLETNVGSFKILQQGEVFPSGDLTMSFSGSVMISGLNGKVVPEGNVRREYNEPTRERQVWFGDGKLTVSGSFQAVQWFGRNLKAKFNGNGIIRLYGEFDKNLETGSYWFDPAKKNFWGNFGATVVVPEVKAGPAPGTVKTRDEFEKGKSGGKG